MDTNGLKLIALFPAARRTASQEGTCAMDLWSLISTARYHVKADVQACEGFNSLTKNISERSPGISLQTLSSRLQLKKALGVLG